MLLKFTDRKVHIMFRTYHVARVLLDCANRVHIYTPSIYNSKYKGMLKVRNVLTDKRINCDLYL